jgi:hypothetical protein
MALLLLFANTACVNAPGSYQTASMPPANNDAQMGYCEKQGIAASSTGQASATFQRCMAQFSVGAPSLATARLVGNGKTPERVEQDRNLCLRSPDPKNCIRSFGYVLMPDGSYAYQTPYVDPNARPTIAEQQPPAPAQTASSGDSSAFWWSVLGLAVLAAATSSNSDTPTTTPSTPRESGCNMINVPLAMEAGPFGGAFIANNCH